jgi:hypothetical protein
MCRFLEEKSEGEGEEEYEGVLKVKLEVRANRSVLIFLGISLK